MSNYYSPYATAYPYYNPSASQGVITNLPGYGYSPYSYSSSTQYSYAPQTLPTVSLPRISYTERSLSDMLAEARSVIEPQYTTQLRQTDEAYGDNRANLASQYVNQRSSIEQAASDRGFGRSSYVVDALAQSQGYEKDDNLKLDKQYHNAIGGITDAREQAIVGYADQLRREQQQIKLQVDQYNQQMALKEAELNQTYRLREYQTLTESMNRMYAQQAAPSVSTAITSMTQGAAAPSYTLPTYGVPKTTSSTASAKKTTSTASTPTYSLSSTTGTKSTSGGYGSASSKSLNPTKVYI